MARRPFQDSAKAANLEGDLPAMAHQRRTVVCGHGFRVEHRALIARECLSAEGIEEEPEQQAVLLCLALLLLFWLQAQQKGVFIQHLKLAGNNGALGMVSR